MEIYDVIGSLRKADFDTRHDVKALALKVSLMEVYLAKVTDYPAPGVSRETLMIEGEVASGQGTLF